jgi:hypothetical protein
MEGWGDDDFDLDLDLDLDTQDNLSESKVIERGAFESVSNAKIFENDSSSIIHDSPKDQKHRYLPEINHQSLCLTEWDIAHSLEEYLQTLPQVITSLKAVFEAQNDEIENAIQLVKYYESRPQLRDYTIKAELPRMDYIVITKEKRVLESKKEVEDYMLTQPDNVIIRSANQSLLADVISNLTGQDLFIRPQYFASAMASKCKFTIDQSKVHCDCRLCLSLPGHDGCSLKVAELDIIIDFNPGISYIMYNLSDFMLCIGDIKILEESARFLASILSQEANEGNQIHLSHPDVFRDSLLIQLSKTRQVIEYGQVGLSSAWEQLDRATSVTQKLKFVKSVGNAFLPTLPTIHFEDQTYELEENQISKINLASNMSESVDISHINHDPQKRVPMIGGLLMSGLSRLTNRIMPRESEDVTVPRSLKDEDRVLSRNDTAIDHFPSDGPQWEMASHIQTGSWDNMYHRSIETNLKSTDDLNCGSNGWSDDEFSIEEQILFEESDAVHDPTVLSNFESIAGIHNQQCKSDYVQAETSSIASTENWRTSIDLETDDYKPELDILPTRRRWVNIQASTGRFCVAP